MTAHEPAFASHMPPLRPLAFPRQAFGSPHSGERNPKGPAGAPPWVRGARLAVFLPALAITGGMLLLFLDWFAKGGLTWIEIMLTGLIGFGIFWISLNFATALLGAASLRPRPVRRAEEPVPPLDVALLVPIFNEAPQMTFGNAGAMMEALSREQGSGHRFTLYMLSDTQDPALAAREERAFGHLRAHLPETVRVHYRRRASNTDRKVGNLTDWVVQWGGAHDAMLVMDADSLMSAPAIRALTDALARDESAGLIQSFPQLIGARTLFARTQEFAHSTYGTALAQGLARWTGQEGNYWGHNAIIRTRAFAASAGLPRLRGGQMILSHDIVEAGLMRRAGWGVRLLPRVAGSWEETPPALLDHVERDRRWCQGNLQHLRLLRACGLHGVSRFHMLHGAVGYLLSPLWLVLLTTWAVIGPSEDRSVLAFFSPDMPLRPTWPEMGTPGHVGAMLVVYGLLVAPKLIGAAVTLLGRRARLRVGGLRRFTLGLIAEIFLSVLYAPILMVQQTRAVGEALLGRVVDWTEQDRFGASRALSALVAAHWLETVLGFVLLSGIATGLVSVWLLPVALSLGGAVAWSWLSARPMPTHWLATPQSLRAPAIRRAALRWQAALDAALGETAQPARQTRI